MTSQDGKLNRETARQIVEATQLSPSSGIEQSDAEDLIARIATALANIEADAYARAKAEDASIVGQKISCLAETGISDSNWHELEALPNAILASSPGPELEEQVRAEAVKAINERRTHWHKYYSIDRFCDDLIAAITKE